MNKFDECLQEAKGLVKRKQRNEFMPALDDLVNEDIESVVMKVQLELDLAEEGEIVTHYQTKRKAQAFIDKWSAVADEEKEEEEDKEVTEQVKKLLLAEGTKKAQKAHNRLVAIKGQVFRTPEGTYYIVRKYRLHEYVMQPIEKVTGLSRESYNARKQ